MENNSLWHEVSEEEKEEIRHQAKNILNEFSKKLEGIKAPEGHFENEAGTRSEGDGWQTDEEFKNTSLANAPLVEDGSIVAEKGAWKK